MRSYSRKSRTARASVNFLVGLAVFIGFALASSWLTQRIATLPHSF